MKNGFIVILLLAVGFLFYQNSTLRSQVKENQSQLQNTQEQISKIQTKVAQQSLQMAARPQNAGTNPSNGDAINTQAATSPTPSHQKGLEQERLESLLQDRQQLQQQIKELTPQNLNGQIQQRQAELAALQNQLKSYQGSEQNYERNTNSVLQYQRTLNQQTQTLLETRIRNQERAIATTRREIRMAQLNGTFYQDDRVAYLQVQLANQQNALQALTAQKEAAANQAVQQTSDIGDRANNAKAVMANAQNSIQNHMTMIRQEIDSLNQQKNQIQATINQYKQDLSELNQAIQEQTRVVKETP